MSVFEINAVGPLLVAQNFSPFLKPSPSCALPVISILTSKMGSIDDNGSGGMSWRASTFHCTAKN